jgi:GxxExxY protein
LRRNFNPASASSSQKLRDLKSRERILCLFSRSLVCTLTRVLQNPAGLNALTEKIIGCGITVHRVYGPGLLESIYHECFIVELRQVGLLVEREKKVPVTYRGVTVGRFKIDCLVEDKIVVEVKAIESLAPVHTAQLITYLKLTGCPIGLLMNFNVPILKSGVRRVLHPGYHDGA